MREKIKRDERRVREQKIKPSWSRRSFVTIKLTQRYEFAFNAWHFNFTAFFFSFFKELSLSVRDRSLRNIVRIASAKALSRCLRAARSGLLTKGLFVGKKRKKKK